VPTAAHSRVSAFFAGLKFYSPSLGGSVASVAKVDILKHHVSLSNVFIVPEFRCQFSYSCYLSTSQDIMGKLNAVFITGRKYVLHGTATV
jgi:hypothetical protein